MKIILSSHSKLAFGMKDTVELIMGKQKDLLAIGAYIEDDIDFKNQINSAIEPFGEEEIIFVTDVLGGSVNNIVSGIVDEKEDYYLITGMNLPLLLELLSINLGGNHDEIVSQLSDVVIEAAKGIQLIDFSENTELSAEDEF